jgi:hypothetical protein
MERKMKIYRDQDGTVVHIGEWCHENIPSGWQEDQAEVVVGWDGGLYLADDPRRLG